MFRHFMVSEGFRAGRYKSGKQVVIAKRIPPSRGGSIIPAGGAVTVLLGLALAGCQLAGPSVSEQAFQPSRTPVTIDTVGKNNRLAAIARAQHPRILATYGGEYPDAKL